jgi:hypothetical protein
MHHVSRVSVDNVRAVHIVRSMQYEAYSMQRMYCRFNYQLILQLLGIAHIYIDIYIGMCTILYTCAQSCVSHAEYAVQ